MGTIQLEPIGFVSSPVTGQVDEDWGAVISRVLLEPEFAGGLLGLKGFSHGIIATYLHQAHYEKRKHLQRRPQGLESMPRVGVFAQRTKDRPNPIGITAVRILSVGDDYLQIQGLDAIDGTPVIDIKPYYPQYDRVETPTVPEWVSTLMDRYF